MAAKTSMSVSTLRHWYTHLQLFTNVQMVDKCKPPKSQSYCLRHTQSVFNRVLQVFTQGSLLSPCFLWLQLEITQSPKIVPTISQINSLIFKTGPWQVCKCANGFRATKKHTSKYYLLVKFNRGNRLLIMQEIFQVTYYCSLQLVK